MDLYQKYACTQSGAQLEIQSAVELSREQIGMVADALPILHILASPPQDLVRLFPKCLLHNCGNDLPGLILEHHPLLGRQKFLLFGEHIHNAHLVAHIILLVFGVGNDARKRGMCNPFPVVIAVALLRKACGARPAQWRT